MKVITAIAIFLFIFSVCKEDINGPALLTHYEQWLSFNIHNYKIEQVRTCFCINGGERMDITVLADTVFSVVRISDETVIPYPASKHYLTIDSLFRTIQNHLSDSLVVTYDPQYGYPSKLDINPQLHPVDGGQLFQTSNLQVINE